MAPNFGRASEDEIDPDDIGPQHIGKVIRLEHSAGMSDCGILDFYSRSNMGLHLVFRGGHSASIVPAPPRKSFRAQKEADHERPRVFVRT